MNELHEWGTVILLCYVEIIHTVIDNWIVSSLKSSEPGRKRAHENIISPRYARARPGVHITLECAKFVWI